MTTTATESLTGLEQRLLGIIATDPRRHTDELAALAGVDSRAARLALRHLARSALVIPLAGPEHGDPTRYRLPNC